jgi:hypothetical protein
MQKQFLDRPMQNPALPGPLLQVDIGKAKSFKPAYQTEKRNTATNKKRTGTLNTFAGLNASTPEKGNSQLQGLLNALNMSQTSKGKSQPGSRNKATAVMGANTVCGCCVSASCRKKGHRTNYLTGGPENPYSQCNVASFLKSNDQSNKSQNAIQEQSSNGSLKQEVAKEHHKKRKTCASNGLEMRGPIEDPLFFRAAQQLDQDRGLSNDVAVLMNHH